MKRATEQIRIALTGTHSTGKTTVLNELKALFGPNEIYCIENISRGVIGRGFPLGKDATVDSYVNYVRDQLRAERESILSDCRLVVSCRTVLDAVGYARANSPLPCPFIPSYFVDMLMEISILEASFYDLYTYFPIEFDMVEDGLRPRDEAYRAVVDREINELLVNHSLPSIAIHGTPKARVCQLMEWLEAVQDRKDNHT